MTQQKHYCQNCNAPLVPDSRFCENCGRAVAAQPASPPKPTLFSAPPQAYADPTPPRWTNRGLVIGLGVAGVVGLLGCGVAAAIFIYRTIQLPINLPQAATVAAVLPTERPTGSQPSLTTQPSAAQATSVSPTAMPSDTEPVPSSTAVPSQPIKDPLTRYDFEGVFLTYDPSLASAVEPQVEPAETGMVISPQYRRLVFLSYPQSQSVHQAYISIFNAEEYYAIPDGGDQVATLQQMLLGRPLASLPDPLPFFNRLNAGQMMAAKIEYLDFRNGSGVRYLTQYGQDVYPIHNYGLFYTFQGMTSDKKWLISAVMPVSNAALPDPETLTSDPDFFDNYEAYLESAILLLDDLSPSSFLPDLVLLDALFQSLEVQ